MKKVQLYPEDISKILSTEIKNNNVLFVFPTDVVMNSWIDWIVTHPSESGTDAVAFENFTAWDNFKREFVSAQKDGESVIPTILRKMFITDLISKNALKPRNERLQVIINPEDTYAKEADSFSDWLSKNLQSLHFWKKRLDENREEYGELDSEDKDYLYLYEQYSKFLSTNNLFESAWVENIDFSEKSKSIHIFYPELLEDFTDYKDIFDNVPNITIYTLPEDIPAPEAYFYPDSRSELRQTMLSIIDLVKQGKADWSEIVLSVPNLDTYRPYLEREFDLYGIPYVIKAGVSLTTNSAGRIFREIYDCYNSDFSFDSVRTLLLDECVPWKDEFTKIKEDLIREGNRMRCICSIKNKDIWLRAFQAKINSLTWSLKTNHSNPEDIQHDIKYFDALKAFYQNIRNTISLFFPKVEEANTFENIRTSWMNFKAQFLKSDTEFSEDANNILSRCIKELSEIIEIEKKYKDCNLHIPSPYTFFLQELDKKTYTKQTKSTGVIIFPYKLSAAAYFKYQFVIDSSQKNLDISYKRLTYLNNTKRGKLKLTNDDKMINASQVFIKLYAKSNKDIIHFSAAENTFNGFAIPHSQLKIITDSQGNNVLPNYNNDDYIIQEKLFISSPEEITLPIKIIEKQKESYTNWINNAITNDIELQERTNDLINNQVKEVLINNRKGSECNNKIKITARGDLEQFFPCPRKWLFKSVLKLHEDTLDTNLMQGYDMGNLNHKILEKFMKLHKGNILPFYDKNEDKFKIKHYKEGDIEVLPEDYTENIISLLYSNDAEENNIVVKAIKDPSDFRDSPLVIDTLLSQKDKIADTIYSFLKKLLLPYGEEIDAKGNIKNINGIGNCQVVGIEECLTATKENYDYLGIIDCFVLSPDNDWIIIDYKNTQASIPSKKNIYSDEYGLLKDFQMPLYYDLLSDYNKKEIAAGYFYAIQSQKSAMVTDKFVSSIVKDSVTDDTDYDLSETRKVLDNYSNLFIEKVSKGDFVPVTSKRKEDKLNVKYYDNCKGCPYKSICRTTYSVGGKIVNDPNPEKL